VESCKPAEPDGEDPLHCAGFSGRFPQLLSRNVVLRTGTKEIARHVVIALANIACVALFWQFFSIRRDVISRLSIAIAYPALFLTAAAVCIGPWNVLRGRTNSVSFDLRRDLGIWAGIMALLHTGIGLNVYLRGRPWLYFIDQHHRVRHDLFGIGNDTGLLAALLFLLLLAISNDLSLRHLGTRIWKSLQRWTYLAVALTLMHAVAYQFVEKRRAHTTRYYGLRSQRLPCSRLRDGAERRENGIGAHWYLQASNRLLDGLR
jgi:methionine sulfoxide reductase heme-binding subunit